MPASHRALKHPNDTHRESLSATERFCRKISDATGNPITLAAVILIQAIWIVLGQVTRDDPFPFIFMLTVSNVVQLVLIVVLAVAGKQQAQHAEARAEHDHDALARILHLSEINARMALDTAAHTGAIDAANAKSFHGIVDVFTD